MGERLPAARGKRYLAWPSLGNQPHDPGIRGMDDLVSLVLARIKEPADLIAQSMGGGDADPISPLAIGERLRGLLPDARLHVARGGGHDLAQTHAAEIAPLIADHLR